jgi:hypothetical protein
VTTKTPPWTRSSTASRLLLSRLSTEPGVKLSIWLNQVDNERSALQALVLKPESDAVSRGGATPVAPVIYPRRFPVLLLEERQERWLGLDRHHAVLVEPHAAEDEAEELALGGGVGLGGPEDREVLEHLAGLVEVRGRLARNTASCCSTCSAGMIGWSQEWLARRLAQ